MKKLIKMAILSLVMLVAMPVCAQDHLTPYGYDWKKNYSRENYVCWGYRVEPSFEDSYEIKCIRNASEQKYYLVMNEKKLEWMKNWHIISGLCLTWPCFHRPFFLKKMK